MILNAFLGSENKKGINTPNIEEAPLKSAPECNPFDILNKLFKIINYSSLDKYKDDIKDILDNNNTSSILGFIVYLLNHSLVYNKYLRQNIDMFVKLSYGLDSREYIEWYVWFMIYNKIRFSDYRVWYKFNTNSNKYKENIINELNLNDDEYDTILNNLKPNSIKNINYILQLNRS